MPFSEEKSSGKRVKEKQVKVLRDLVTVNREPKPDMSLGNREGAFKDEAEAGDLPYMRFKYIFRVRRMCFFVAIF